MRIPHKICYSINGVPKTYDFYDFIQSHCSCAYGASLSEFFQVLKDTPDRAVYRINHMIDVNDGWIGQLVDIDLKHNTIGLGGDWAINGPGYSNNLHDKKANGDIIEYHDILWII